MILKICSFCTSLADSWRLVFSLNPVNNICLKMHWLFFQFPVALFPLNSVRPFKCTSCDESHITYETFPDYLSLSFRPSRTWRWHRASLTDRQRSPGFFWKESAVRMWALLKTCRPLSCLPIQFSQPFSFTLRSQGLIYNKPYHLFLSQAHHLHCLNDFVEAQMTYYAQCYQYMVDLQKQLGK